ncbi:hypothetical protein C2G38_2052003, partial [Gigaspora rosea]
IPTKRTCTSLIKGVIPNMVKTHPDWNGISTKLRQAFENFRSTYNDDVAKLANHLIRKKRQSSVKVLKTFIAKSLKIHLEYLIAESKGEDPDYNSMVLNRIKGLDNITINTTFLAASHLQYANQLELKEEQESVIGIRYLATIIKVFNNCHVVTCWQNWIFGNFDYLT